MERLETYSIEAVFSNRKNFKEYVTSKDLKLIDGRYTVFAEIDGYSTCSALVNPIDNRVELKTNGKDMEELRELEMNFWKWADNIFPKKR